jgi:phosphoribosylpyrophosphate synthetase
LTGTGGTAECDIPGGAGGYTCAVTFDPGSAQFQGHFDVSISGQGCNNVDACIDNNPAADHPVTITPDTPSLPPIYAANNAC